MKAKLTFLLIVLGAILAPGLSLASGPNALIQERHPEATLKSLYANDKKRDWIYEVTPASGQPVYVAYGRARSRSGYYYILLTATPAGKILSVELPNYPHAMGRRAASPSFLKQYEDQTNVHYGSEIHGVTGATSTGKSTADKVRSLLKLIKKVS